VRPTPLSWKGALVRGAIAVVLGIIAVFWPSTAIFTFMVLWGLWALVDGIAVLFLAFDPAARASRTVHLVQGVLGVVVGLLIVTHPGLSASVVTWLAGVWFAVRGLFSAFLAFGTSPRGALLVSAAIDLVLGVLFMVNPGGSAKGITIVLGIVALIWGIALVVIALMWRRHPIDPVVTA
jgi:uncharacterized membrane protein HdeD (DUF308 family)